MADSGDIKVVFQGEQTVEWTMMPVDAMVMCSDDFTLGDSACYLRVDYDSNGYILCLSWCSLPSSPLQVTAYLLRGTDLLMPQTAKIECDNRFYDLWEGKQSEVSRILPDFEERRLFCFRVVFHRLRRGHECPEHKPQISKCVSDSSGCLESLAFDLSRLQEDTSSHDIKLRCDGQVLSAHKNILSARSEVFKAMLQADMQEKRTGFVAIQDMTHPTLQCFLRYLYTGTLPDLTVELALQLYEAGDKYAVGALLKKCSQFLKCSMEVSNTCKILTLADAHNDQDLKDSALDYIEVKEIPKNWDGWMEFCDNHQKLAIEVLNYLYIGRTMSK